MPAQQRKSREATIDVRNSEDDWLSAGRECEDPVDTAICATVADAGDSGDATGEAVCTASGSKRRPAVVAVGCRC